MNLGRKRLFATAVVGALVVAGCSSDTVSPTTTAGTVTISPAPVTTAAQTTTPPAPSAPREMTFGFIASNLPLLWDIGFAQQNALSLAVADINDGGGVLGAPVDAMTAGSGTGDTVTSA